MMTRTAKWVNVRRPDGFPTTIALPQLPGDDGEEEAGVGDDPLFPSFVVAKQEYEVADYGRRGRKKPDFVRKDEDDDKPIRWRKI